MKNPILAALAIAALAASTLIAPAASAYQPVPTVHLQTTLNPKAWASNGQNWVDLGDLSATRYVVVTATNMQGASSMTILFQGAESLTRRSVYLANNETVVLDFGSVQNADGLGEFTMYLPSATRATNLSLDIHAVGAVIVS